MCNVCVQVEAGDFEGLIPLAVEDSVVQLREVGRVNKQIRYYINTGNERELAGLLMAVRHSGVDHWDSPYCHDLMREGLRLLQSKGWLNCERCLRTWDHGFDFLVSQRGKVVRATQVEWERQMANGSKIRVAHALSQFEARTA